MAKNIQLVPLGYIEIISDSEAGALRCATEMMGIDRKRITRVEDRGDEGRASYIRKGVRCFRLYVRDLRPLS